VIVTVRAASSLPTRSRVDGVAVGVPGVTRRRSASVFAWAVPTSSFGSADTMGVESPTVPANISAALSPEILYLATVFLLAGGNCNPIAIEEGGRHRPSSQPGNASPRARVRPDAV
jgi:hypothetical protein